MSLVLDGPPVFKADHHGRQPRPRTPVRRAASGEAEWLWYIRLEFGQEVEAMKIIVIGATGTIGREVAKALSAKKHEVLRASRNGDLKVDLDDRGSIRTMFERVSDIDAVVSCAGSAVFKPYADLTEDDYELGLRSKLMGQVSLAKIATDVVREGGSITLTTGVLAMHPIPGSASISMVNAGLEGFVRAAALEMPRRLRINAVSPPWVRETLLKLGMSSTPGLPSADVAKAYVAAVEGTQQGEVIAAR
jgi:NAD(P)-dependent dehydrogenase (short-subunit alcohol dehydrogenase family)